MMACRAMPAAPFVLQPRFSSLLSRISAALLSKPWEGNARFVPETDIVDAIGIHGTSVEDRHRIPPPPITFFATKRLFHRGRL